MKWYRTAGLALVSAALAGGVTFGQSDGYRSPAGDPQPQGSPYDQGQPYNQRQPGYQDPSDPRFGAYDQGDDRRDSYDDNYDDYDNDTGRQVPNVEVGFFYRELSPYGEWVHRYPYGWVWFPRHVPADWRPYSYGRWVDSDYGWTWASDEPFGWATYHYGRWAWDSDIGWLWVPGTVWGPAWVAWQQGGGYVGWAPLPPEVGFQIGVGLRLGGLNLSFAIQPTRYSFVEERQFLEARVSGFILPPARNVTIIHNTLNITNYTFDGDRVVNHGVPIERIERATGRRVHRLRVAEAASSAGSAGGIRNDQLRIYRPSRTRLETVRVAERNNAGLRQAPPQPRERDGRPEPARPHGAPRIEVAPRATPMPRENVDRRQRQEQIELNRREDEDRRQLEKIQKQEMSRNPGQARSQEVKERHAAEVQVQQEEHDRGEQQLRTRQQIAREAEAASAEKAPKAPPAQQPERGRGKNKDKNKEKDKDHGDDHRPPPSSDR